MQTYSAHDVRGERGEGDPQWSAPLYRPTPFLVELQLWRLGNLQSMCEDMNVSTRFRVL